MYVRMMIWVRRAEFAEEKLPRSQKQALVKERAACAEGTIEHCIEILFRFLA